MAEKKSGKAESGKASGKAKAAMGLAQNVLAFALAGAIAAGVGVFQGLHAKPPDRRDSGAAKAEQSRNYAPVVEMGTMDLPPIVTNLASPQDVWVRLEGTLLFEGKDLPHGEALAAQIAGDLLAYMRTQTLRQIQGAAGLQHLRQDLADRVATRSDGRARELIIRSLVVQ